MCFDIKPDVNNLLHVPISWFETAVGLLFPLPFSHLHKRCKECILKCTQLFAVVLPALRGRSDGSEEVYLSVSAFAFAPIVSMDEHMLKTTTIMQGQALVILHDGCLMAWVFVVIDAVITVCFIFPYRKVMPAERCQLHMSPQVAFSDRQYCQFQLDERWLIFTQ